MSETNVAFDDAAAYERFMGRWSRAIGREFLGWLSPAAGLRWLDVGCGTGVFTQTVVDACSPAGIIAVDPSAVQLEYAREQPVARKVEFCTADALDLPFPDASFDIVVSALVLNLIDDRLRALKEMRRVCRPGGTVAAYVWDFAAGRSAAWPMVRGICQIGVESPRFPGSEDTSLDAIASLFERAGCEGIAARPIDATIGFSSFDDFWRSQAPPFSSHGKIIERLPDAARAKLATTVQAILSTDPDGAVAYSARANAAKARAPK